MSTIPSEKYWKKLLALSTSATTPAADSTTSGEAPSTMSVEDQAWVQEAINELAQVEDPIAQMTSCMMEVKKRLMDGEFWSPEDRYEMDNVLATIDELICDIDLAVSFCRYDGLKLMNEVLEKVQCEGALKWAAQILASSCENNPDVQKQVLETTLLGTLLKLLKNDKSSQIVRKTFVSAISAIVRNNKDCFEKFIELGGYVTLASVALKADRSCNEALLHRICVAMANIARGLEPDEIDKHRIHWTLAETLLALEVVKTCVYESVGYLVDYFKALTDEQINVSPDCLRMLRRLQRAYLNE
ncbi:hypothetical protein L596_000562 [Steinernema carpocapsae]|uniref:Nucleotide exchange factor Fes1 domain-containing protein n=1 Tax=Steinernema carpocapsae TaxID=34508 RepID=A0A4U8UIG0_STECR|nr:hypothetical protein L596_000562 [Steinernema carpocapsae]